MTPLPPTLRCDDIAVVDLFCGAGGLTYGLRQAGLRVVVGADLDPSCRHPFEANCGANFVETDVAKLSSQQIAEWFGDASVKVLAGCAPCQPFSTYSQSRKSVDDRWKLLEAFQRLVVEVRPEIVTMENVKGLSSQPIWNTFVTTLLESGYQVAWSEVDCTKYGIPQTRHRLVLLASLLGPIELLAPDGSKSPTVREVIADLPAIAAGGSRAGVHELCCSTSVPEAR